MFADVEHMEIAGASVRVYDCAGQVTRSGFSFSVRSCKKAVERRCFEGVVRPTSTNIGDTFPSSVLHIGPEMLRNPRQDHHVFP